MNNKKLVFSGVQPTGNLHLGNYLGALKNFVSLQKEMECIYCVVDLHAITVFQKPSELYNNVLETTASFLATGLNPDKSIIFNQSSVSGHSELAWILNCVSRIGWLNRMTQFKDKAGSDKEKASVGLYIYPNLMAADILLYKATHVPVGADQKQHLELSRDIAQKFNNDFDCKNFFPLPEPLIPKNISRVMSLRDATKKMSKSEESDYSRINLKDSADEINRKIRKAKSDSQQIPDNIKLLENKPEALNLLNIYSEISKNKLEAVVLEMAGKEYSFLKTKLAEILIEEIIPIGKELQKLLKDKSYLKTILQKGSEKASIIAEENLKNIRDKVGLIQYKAFMIETEATPNPDSIKFLSEKTISVSGTEEFQKEQKDKVTIPFVKELLDFKGVELILLSEKFLSVKKTKEVSWNELKPLVISHLNDYFSKNNEPILNNKRKKANNTNNNSEIVNKIMEVLDTKVRPAVARDGGDIKFVSFENGVVKVLLQGSCSGCPSSLMTLKQGVQNLLKHYVKEVNAVEAVQ